MNSGLIYYIYQRLVNGVNADQPIWALLICIFFAFVLSSLIFICIRLLIQKKLRLTFTHGA